MEGIIGSEHFLFAGGGLADWYHVKDIVEDADGSFWIATANYGIIHIMGDVQHPETLKYSNYSYNNGQLATNSVLCLHVDKSGRLWAGTEGGGLYLYDYKEKCIYGKESGISAVCRHDRVYRGRQARVSMDGD